MKYTSIFALTLLAAASALASNNISWVASTGVDTADCTRPTPCRTFQGAYGKTNVGGIIKAADCADFGGVNVSQAITIDGNGVGAEIEVTAAIGIGINTISGPVTIRDLTIHVVPGQYGIQAQGDIHIENVAIVGAPQYGVVANARLTAKNLTVTGATSYGILILSGGSASIRDSVVRIFFGGQGITVQTQLPGAAAVALIEHSEMSFNSIGLLVDNTGGGGATVRVSDCVITGNTTGISAINGGQIISFRTNMLAGNTTDGATPFSISLK